MAEAQPNPPHAPGGGGPRRLRGRPLRSLPADRRSHLRQLLRRQRDGELRGGVPERVRHRAGRAGGGRRRHLVRVRLAAGRLRHARAAQRDGGHAPPATCSCRRSSAWRRSSTTPTRRSSSCRRRACCAWRCMWPWSASSSSRARPRPSGLAVLKGLGSDLSGLLASPPAMGLAALWLVGSLALVGLFPREPIGDAASTDASRGGADRDAGSRGADRVAQVARRAAEAGGGAARRRREGAGAEVQRLPVPRLPHDLHGVSRHHRQVPGLAPGRVPVRDPRLPAGERMRVRGHSQFCMRGGGRGAAGARKEQGRRARGLAV